MKSTKKDKKKKETPLKINAKFNDVLKVALKKENKALVNRKPK